MIDVNVKGVLYGIAAALPYMQKHKAGHIINVSDVAGHKVGPGSAVYAATKHAILARSEGLRQEVKPYNIRTTVISLGEVATELPNSVTDPAVVARIHKLYEEIAIPAESFARAVAFAIRPTRQELVRLAGNVDNISEFKKMEMTIKRSGTQPSSTGPAE